MDSVDRFLFRVWLATAMTFLLLLASALFKVPGLLFLMEPYYQFHYSTPELVPWWGRWLAFTWVLLVIICLFWKKKR